MRRFSTGERIVFLPYTEETYAKTQAWIHERLNLPRQVEAELSAVIDHVMKLNKEA